MESAFEQANSANLPKVHMDMLDIYYRKNAQYLIAGVQHVKSARSGRSSYVDDAIGYVQLKREHPNCIIKARITPEHRVRQKGYLVSATIDENEEEILDCHCHDCAASEGGCKHAIALLYWLLKRNDQPAVTSTVCYWKKATLAIVGSLEPVQVASISNRTIPSLPPKSDTFLNEVVEAGIENSSKGCVFSFFHSTNNLVEEISLHHFITKYLISCRGSVGSASDFIEFCKNKIDSEKCKQVCAATVKQSDCPEWFAARFGRITASKLHEAAHCQTLVGSLAEAVLGASKFVQTNAMKRGLDLEKKVIKIVCGERNLTYQKSGIVIDPQYPIFGASPDAITDEFCIEAKCPSRTHTIQNYIKDGKITSKPYAQLQLQMFLCKKTKGLFCVASPNFEEDNKVEVIEVQLDVDFCKDLISKSEQLWKKAIFYRLV